MAQEKPARSVANNSGDMMNLVKTSVIAFALSALVASPVLAQGLATDSEARSGVQGKSLPGTIIDDEEDLAVQPPAADKKVGIKPTKGIKGGSGTTGIAPHKGLVEDSATGAPLAGKRN
ncbi:hypothetical protein [Bradyrhizobium sp. ARR65]|uniref:hypothetical protein n=1 Tax=Bradyrhizobium sp. ARR65 TaxID=1040989 RepID=UPI001FD9B0D8|nr:hypothetical protein [Bradyrhizobium sp. ARR65]